MTHNHEDHEERGHDVFGFISGMLLGGLVGAAAGLLMAPYSGKETRMMLQEKGIELKDQVETTARETRDRVETAARDLRAKAETVVDDTRTKLEGAVDNTRTKLETNKERLGRTAEAVTQAAQEAWRSNESV